MTAARSRCPSSRGGCALVWPVLAFAWRHVLTRRTPMGRKEMKHIRFHGGPMLRVKRADLDKRGVDRTEERVVGVEHGKPVLADGRRARTSRTSSGAPATGRTSTGSTCR